MDNQDPTRIRATSMDGACEMMNISRFSMRKLLREGKIHGVRVGVRWIIPIKSIETFLQPVELPPDDD